MILSGKRHANASRYFYSGNHENVKKIFRPLSSLRTDSIRERQAGLGMSILPQMKGVNVSFFDGC
jgi:hypothetical protein